MITHPCPECHTPVCVEVKHLDRYPHGIEDDNVLCDDCYEWSDPYVWYRISAHIRAEDEGWGVEYARAFWRKEY